MVDTKQTNTVGEHHVVSTLARCGWAPALTRDGLERTDIFAVDTTDPVMALIDFPQSCSVKFPRGAGLG